MQKESIWHRSIAIRGAINRSGAWLKNLNLGGRVALVILLILVTTFYWFQIRPARIRAVCDKEASEEAKELLQLKIQMSPWDKELQEGARRGLFLRPDYENYYRSCLRKRGLE